MGKAKAENGMIYSTPREERRDAVAAYDAMAAARPLRPPAGRFERVRPRAAELALAKDMRLGLVRP